MPRRRSERRNGMNETVCIGCGCTERNACVDLAGEACRWVAVSVDGMTGICSACAVKPIEELLAGPPKVKVAYAGVML